MRQLFESLRGLAAAVAVATIALALVSWLRADDKPASRPLEGKLIWVGDSITAGESVSAEQSFVGLLQARAKAEQPNLTVIGQGRSGWATDTFLQNAKTVVDAMPDDATLIAIQLGTNDAHSNAPPEQIAAKCAANLQKLMKLYHDKAPHAAFIVVAPTAVEPKLLSPRLRAADYSERTPVALKSIHDAYHHLSQREKLKFIDLSRLPSPGNTVDGVHPNAAGHAEIADAIWKALGS